MELSQILQKELVENCELENLEKLMDSKTPKDATVFFHLMSLGLKCVSKNHRHRPEMEIVLKELEQPLQCEYSFPLKRHH